MKRSKPVLSETAEWKIKAYPAEGLYTLLHKRTNGLYPRVTKDVMESILKRWAEIQHELWWHEATV